MRSSLRLSIAGLFLIVTGLFAISASAATVNVDFNRIPPVAGTYSGAGVDPSWGTLWNGVQVGNATLSATFTSGALLNSLGGATTTTFTLGNFRAYDTTPDPNIALTAPALLNDYAYGNTTGPASITTFSVNNLTSGGLYNLYVYSQNGGYSNGSVRFTINGQIQDVINVTNPTSFLNGANYAYYPNLVATGGTISGTVFSNAVGAFLAFNGFQIQEIPVPEPSTLTLLAVGIAGLWTARRRRRAIA